MYIMLQAAGVEVKIWYEHQAARSFAERLLSLRFASARPRRQGSAPQNLGSASFLRFGAGMADLLEEVLAVDSWLVGLRDSSLFAGQVDLQAKRLEDLLKKAQPRTLCQVTTALKKVRQQPWWSQEQLQRLEQACAAAAARTGDTRQQKGSHNKSQDYRFFLNYFSQGVWNKLLDKKLSAFSKLTLVCSKLPELGLRTVSESTVRLVTALLLSTPGSEGHGPTPLARHQSFLVTKDQLHRYVETRGAMFGLRSYISVLPENPANLPEDWRDNLEDPIPCPLDRQALAVVESSVPLRKSHKDLRRQGSASGDSSNYVASLLNALEDYKQKENNPDVQLDVLRPGNFLQLEQAESLQGSCSEGLAAPRSQSTGLERTPALAVAQPEEAKAEKPVAVAELEQEGEEKAVAGCSLAEGLAVPSKKKAEPPLLQLQDLRSPSPQEASLPGNTGRVLDAAELLSSALARAKPAKRLTEKTSLEEATQRRGAKRVASPAAKAAASKPSAGRKKTASARPAKSSGSRTSAADREAFLATLPKSVKAAYKHGCSSCSYREYCTRSCWAKRGW